MIAENLLKVKNELPEGVQLVAVSKYHPESEVMEAYGTGQRIFGENIVQELRLKQQDLPRDIEWHFIGHLQKNKVKYIAPYVALIHSVDTPELLEEINRQALKNGRTIPCLLQIHIAREETKFGLTEDECRALLSSGTWRNMAGIRLRGLMCMASNVDDEQQVAGEFDEVNALWHEIKNQYFAGDEAFNLRSWGMSHDFEIAVRHGSNMVRVGTRIFGPRPVKK